MKALSASLSHFQKSKCPFLQKMYNAHLSRPMSAQQVEIKIRENIGLCPVFSSPKMEQARTLPRLQFPQLLASSIPMVEPEEIPVSIPSHVAKLQALVAT